jgi:ubiquitin carboxyl-terminal hydrolase L5
MNRYASTETNFALLNICSSRMKHIEQELNELQSSLDELTANNDESFTATINDIRNQMSILQTQLDDLKQEREKQRQENIRRRHNYYPFIMTLLKALSKKGILPKLVEQAKARVAASAIGSKNASTVAATEGK